MKSTGQTNEKYSQLVENNRSNRQTFVYNADEISLEALLDPSFRPMVTPTSPQQVYPTNYHSAPHSLANVIPNVRYDRASFDPSIDLPAVQPFSTLPTRRRRPQSNVDNSAIIHV